MRIWMAITVAKALDKLGSFAWFDANTPHSLHAVSDDAEVVEVEVRRPH